MACETIGELVERFERLNRKKRRDPTSLSVQERQQWKALRRRFEEILFNRPADTAADTREFLRVPVCLSARYWSRNELKDRYISVLGEGGLFVSTVDPLPVGTRLELEIEIATRGLKLPVEGEVAWVNEGDDLSKRGMGIKFVGLSWEQKQAIYSLVDDTLKQRLLERRRHARMDARLDVQFIYAEGFFELQTRDIGIGGMFIATDHLVPPGERLRVVLHIPSPRAVVKASCEVVRVVDDPRPGESPGLGVRFVDIDEKGRRAISQYQKQAALTPQQHDRRRRARVERRVAVRYLAEKEVMSSYARDLSAGGVFIHTPDVLPAGTRLVVSLVNPASGRQIELPARVVRTVEPDPSDPDRVTGMGLAFEAVDEDQKRMLGDLLVELVSMEYDATISASYRTEDPPGAQPER